jgi:Cytochrome C and Quinol oxidase polypeptide I/Domain of unknown function (DUF1993)
MSLSMYQASVPAFLQMLNNLSAVLDKAEAYAGNRKIDPEVLLNYRPAPDMLPFVRQIQIATDLAKVGRGLGHLRLDLLVPGVGAGTAVIYWFPKMTGYIYSETLAKLHFWLMLIGANIAFFPMQFLGLAGMPRRYADYPEAFAGWNFVASIGSYISFAGLLVFFLGLAYAFARKVRAPGNPWGAGATTLEWTLPSPAPFHTYETLPRIT